MVSQQWCVFYKPAIGRKKLIQDEERYDAYGEWDLSIGGAKLTIGNMEDRIWKETE